MGKTQKAVEILPGKLWITYNEDGGKTGTLKISSEDDGWMIQYLTNGEKISYDSDDIEQVFSFAEKTESSVKPEIKQVFGYPIEDEFEPFKQQEKEGLPCFAKTNTSKVFFAAGHYGINFDNGGWMTAFCPKLATLRKYEFIGPFRTLIDSDIAVKRKQR